MQQATTPRRNRRPAEPVDILARIGAARAVLAELAVEARHARRHGRPPGQDERIRALILAAAAALLTGRGLP
jgi:hypothetical protein